MPPVDIEDFIRCCELVGREAVRGTSDPHPVFVIDDVLDLRMLAIRDHCGADQDRFLAITSRFLAVLELHGSLFRAGHLREIDGGVEIDRAVFEVAADHPLDPATRLQFDAPSFLARVTSLTGERGRP